MLRLPLLPRLRNEIVVPQTPHYLQAGLQREKPISGSYPCHVLASFRQGSSPGCHLLALWRAIDLPTQAPLAPAVWSGSSPSCPSVVSEAKKGAPGPTLGIRRAAPEPGVGDRSWNPSSRGARPYPFR